MSKVIYSVVSQRGKWRVKYNNKFYGSFKNKNEAVQSAMYAAEGSIARGFDAHVQINETDCEWKLEWNKRNDLFPFGNRMAA